MNLDHRPLLFDTHCHLNDAEAFPDPYCVIEEALAAGIGRMAVIGVDRDSSHAAIKLAEEHEEIVAVVGWHPNYSQTMDGSWGQELLYLLRHPKVVAIGEIGLDRHWDFATPSQQAECLNAQLEVAEVTRAPVVFHCRKAYADLLDRLETANLERFVLHCFSGDALDLRRAIRLGAYFGFDGPVTYPKAQALREMLAKTPRDRILIETDSPYLAPHPLRGKPNRPALLTYVNAAVAAVLELSEQACAELTRSNAIRFYGIAD